MAYLLRLPFSEEKSKYYDVSRVKVQSNLLLSTEVGPSEID